MLPLFSSFRGARSANPESRDSPMCNRTSVVCAKWRIPEWRRWLPFVRKNNRAARAEHAADAVADRDLRAWHLRRRDAAHLSHTLLQRVHAVHAGMHVAETAAVGIERQLAAGPGVAVGNELAGLFMRHEAEIAEAIQRQMRKRVVDHQVIDILVADAGLLEGEWARDPERARTVERLHLADHRCLDAFTGAEDIDRLGLEILGAVGRGQDQRAAAIGDEAALQDAERIGDHPRVQHILDRDRRLHGGARILRSPFTPNGASNWPFRLSAGVERGCLPIIDLPLSAWVISTVLQSPASIAAAAWRTCSMNEQPPTEVPSTQVGAMPR